MEIDITIKSPKILKLKYLGMKTTNWNGIARWKLNKHKPPSKLYKQITETAEKGSNPSNTQPSSRKNYKHSPMPRKMYNDTDNRLPQDTQNIQTDL
jgi:hypothetical protein